MPEETILAFPVALKQDPEGEKWQPFLNNKQTDDIYLGGLESVGFGHCEMKFCNIDLTGTIAMAWESFNLDQNAHDLVSNYCNEDKETVNQVHKMRAAVAYGLERFWGEQLRLDGKKSEYWRDTWNKFADIMAKAGIDIPTDDISSGDSVAIKQMANKLWDFPIEQRKIALAVLRQLCDCMVWWTQRYKPSRDLYNFGGENNG